MSAGKRPTDPFAVTVNRRVRRFGLWVAGLLCTGIITACGASTPPAAAPTKTPGTSSTPTTDLTAAASTAYATAFNTMIDAVNADIPGQNAASTNPAGATTAINNEVTARQTFDTAVQAISFPSSAQSDAQSVLNTDAALEQALGTLAVNTGDIGNYNSVFDTVTPADNAFTAANAALESDLGLSSVTPTT